MNDSKMFTRILTNVERRLMQNFIRTRRMPAAEKKKKHVSVLAIRCRKFTPQIESDLRLIREFASKYERRQKR